MKSLIIVLAALLAACTGGRQATVTVENDLAVSRENETVVEDAQYENRGADG